MKIEYIKAKVKDEEVMITIRKAKKEDFEDYFKLWKGLKDSDYKRASRLIKEWDKLNPNTIRKYCKKSYLKIISERNRQIYFAEEEKQTVAFIEVAYNGFKETARINKKRGWICELFVDKKHRRKGIATKLKDEGFQWLKKNGLKYIFIDYDPFNKEAEKTYIKWGFKERYVAERMMKLK